MTMSLVSIGTRVTTLSSAEKSAIQVFKWRQLKSTGGGVHESGESQSTNRATMENVIYFDVKLAMVMAMIVGPMCLVSTSVNWRLVESNL